MLPATSPAKLSAWEPAINDHIYVSGTDKSTGSLWTAYLLHQDVSNELQHICLVSRHGLQQDISSKGGKGLAHVLCCWKCSKMITHPWPCHAMATGMPLWLKLRISAELERHGMTVASQKATLRLY